MIKREFAALAKREKHLASVHEAGHLIILTAMGGAGSARIWRNPSKALDEKAWLGQTTMYASPEINNFPPSSKEQFNIITPPPKRWRVYFGMAGVIAECIEDGDDDIHRIFNYLIHATDATDEISETDLSYIGDEWDFDDVAATVEILKARWESLIFEASNMKLFPKDS